MNLRICLSLFLACTCISLMAQPKIVSITYEGDTAILTRNNPPTGVVYYWQGTSCGELMENSEPTYVATTSSTFYIRAYLSSSSVWDASCASTSVIFPDVTAPVLSDVTGGPVEVGDDISATSNEDGMIYLVPDGTAADLGDITTAKVAEATASAGVAVALSTAGLSLGDYIVYAVDEAENISDASAAISVADLTAPVLSDVTGGPVEIGDDISATSNEDGTIYLVPSGTAPSIGDITAAKVAEAAVSAGVPAALSTAGITEGDYILYAVDASENISAASVAISVVDLTAPVLSDVTEGPVEIGDDISATSNEDGTIYLVPDGTAADLGDITAAKVAEAAASAGVPAALSTAGISEGDYIVYAVDASENISTPSSAITVNEEATIVIEDVSRDDIRIYPVVVKDILYIKSRVPVASVAIYTMQGSQVLNIPSAVDHVDVSTLAEGVYIVKIALPDNNSFSGRIIKE